MYLNYLDIKTFNYFLENFASSEYHIFTTCLLPFIHFENGLMDQENYDLIQNILSKCAFILNHYIEYQGVSKINILKTV